MTEVADALDDVDADNSLRREALLLGVARLKLRVEVCLRRDRTSDEYREVLASCLDDVDDIVRAASALTAERARRRR